MAGDWIKMRGNLWDDPRVTRLCDLTDSGEAAVIGGLYWLWATADQHTESGVMPGLSLRQIDRKTGVPGLGQALVEIGWIEDHPEGVRIVNFEDHNGSSAKRRSSDAQRKASVRKMSASDADNNKTEVRRDAELEKEKRREDITEKEKQEKETASPSAPPAAKPKTQGSRLPADFQVPDDWLDWAASERRDIPSAELPGIAAGFVDYWTAKAGAAARKVDWLATWRNWIRNQKRTTGPPGNRPEKFDPLAYVNRNRVQNHDVIDI